MTDRAWNPGGKLGFLGLGFLGLRFLGIPSVRCQTQREVAQLAKTWPNPRDPLVWCRQSKAGLVTDCV